MEYIEDKCKTNNVAFANTIESVVFNAMDLIEVKKQDHTWFTADTHFGSDRARILSKRPFSSVEEMDWEMIKRWNVKIGQNDIVYHVGDFGNPEIIKHLNFKYLFIIPGNYEHDDPENMKQLEENGAEFLEEKNVLLCYPEANILLIHEPENRIKPKRYDNEFYLFGHIHGRQKVKKWGLDVGVDAHDFSPINLNDVFWWINAIKNHYDQNVFL